MGSYYGKSREYLKKIYGMDTLSAVLLLAAVILCLLGSCLPFKPARWLLVPALILVALCGFRFFSTSVARRRWENDSFCRISGPVFDRLSPLGEEKKERRKLKKQKKSLEKEEKMVRKEQDREFRFFNCPHCKQRLRVPRGNGKVEITCPNCGNRFIRKT